MTVEKIKCVKVTRPCTHGKTSCTYSLPAFSAADEFDGSEIGEKITVELIELTKKEFDNLPDFEGW